MATTDSLLASALAAMGSTFPDRIEHIIWRKKRGRHHRRTSHWFVLYGAAFIFCYYRWGSGLVPQLSTFPQELGTHVLETFSTCAAFWFLGGLLHIFCDACCGRVPLLVPWRKTFGWYFFRVADVPGQMSQGETAFVMFVVFSCLSIWLSGHGLIYVSVQ
jgi:hypothetical protein